MANVSALYDQLDGMKKESRHPAQRQQERTAALLGEIQREYVQYFEGEITQCPPEEAQRIQTKVRLSLKSLCALARDCYGLTLRMPCLNVSQPRLPDQPIRGIYRAEERHVVGGGLDDPQRLMTDQATRRAAAILGHEMTADAVA